MPEPAEKPLQSWKEIAAYLERDSRTARRWETEAGLPVRRHTEGKRSSVYAYPSEIDAWRAGRPASPAPASRRRVWLWGAAAVAVVLAAVALSNLDLSGVDAVDAAGQGVQTTELCRGCDWLGEVSPSGRHYSETDWGSSGDIGLRDFETGEIRLLGSKKSWDDPGGQTEYSIFSPDGSRIAYNFWENDYSVVVIRTISVSGEGEKTVFSNPNFRYIIPAGWTRDDRLVVNLQREDWSNALGLISLETSELTILKSIEGQFTKPTLSPDDSWIAYDAPGGGGRPERDIFLLAPDGATERKATQHPADDFVMGFTPDGRTLLFASNRTGSYGLWALPLSADGQPGAPKILMRDIGAVHSIGVAADGSLVYARELGSIDLYRAELDLATGRLLRQPELIQTAVQGSNEGPWLAPDGNTFAYLAQENPVLAGARHRSIRLYDLRSGQESEVDVEDVELIGRYGLIWSPDGKRILTQTRERQGAWGLADIELETRVVNAVLRGVDRQVNPIGWTANGEEVLFISNAGLDPESPETDEPGRSIYSLAPGATHPRFVHAGRVSAFPGTVSPARDRIAWSWKGWGDDRTEVIQVMPVGGGDPEIVYSGDAGRLRTRRVVWAPDGKSLLLQRDSEGPSEVWVLPLDGAPPFKTELNANTMRHLAIHPDGKTVFFQAGDRDVRIFKTENYLPESKAASE